MQGTIKRNQTQSVAQQKAPHKITKANNLHFIMVFFSLGFYFVTFAEHKYAVVNDFVNIVVLRMLFFFPSVFAGFPFGILCPTPSPSTINNKFIKSENVCAHLEPFSGHHHNTSARCSDQFDRENDACRNGSNECKSVND